MLAGGQDECGKHGQDDGRPHEIFPIVAPPAPVARQPAAPAKLDVAVHPTWTEDVLGIEALLDSRAEARERRGLGLENIDSTT